MNEYLSTRRIFLKKLTASIFFTGPIVSILSCSNNDGDPIPSGGAKDCLVNGTSSSISSNHGHDLAVPISDIEAGIPKDYNIGGSAGHDHTVSVSTDNFSQLKSNNSISVTSSSGDGHTHQVTVSCA